MRKDSRRSSCDERCAADPAFHFYYYALENGFYQQEGFQVDIQAIPVETNALRAVASGDMDLEIQELRPPSRRSVAARSYGSLAHSGARTT